MFTKEVIIYVNSTPIGCFYLDALLIDNSLLLIGWYLGYSFAGAFSYTDMMFR